MPGWNLSGSPARPSTSVWSVPPSPKRSDGFSRLPETAVFVVALVASMGLLSYSLRSLPVGTGYAVWVGIGAIGAAIVGVVWLNESAAPMRLVSIGLIAAGVIGLALSSSNAH